MGPEILFMLLPIAALSGWVIGRRGNTEGSSKEGRPFFSKDYFTGLNYLLNEQPDKAVEVFVQMLEVDGETVETHLALGNLFRRRGEVDRAIRIHQNLIARPTLSRPQRNQALYELGRDYTAAGLLDRAEALFEELLNDREYGLQAGQQLLEIFQQEKEWEQAITVARRLQGSGHAVAPIISHFYCELAEQALQQKDYAGCARLLKRALGEDRSNVRVSLLEGRLELEQGSPRSAMKALKRVEGQNAKFLPEIVQPLRHAYEQSGRPLEMLNYLRQLLREHESTTLYLAMAELVGEHRGEAESSATLAGYLQKHPSVWGMHELIELKLARNESPTREDFTLLRKLTEGLLADKPRYRCSNCGFSTKKLNWQCPSCKQWNTVAPIHGIEGE